MSKIIFKTLFPIFLAGIFAITIFVALEYDKMRPEFYLVLFFVSIAIFFFGYSVGEKFASPLQELIERANDLQAGDFSKRVYLDTKDELEELAQIYNNLAEKLQESYDRQRATESTIDLRTRAKTQALEERMDALDQKVHNRTAELEKALKEIDNLHQALRDKEAQIAELKK